MESEPRFATAGDGTRIFWESFGTGAPAIVLADGVGCAGYVWRRFAPDLARRFRVIHFQYRGHGRSEVPRDRERVTLQDCVDDLLTVMDAAGVPSAVIAGHSMGVQVALETHRKAPRRVSALILALGSFGRPLDTFYDSPLMSAIFPVLKRAVLAWPGLVRVAFQAFLPTRWALEIGRFIEVNRQLLPPADLHRYLTDLAAIDPEIFVRMVASAAEADSADHLPLVDVPTLVIAGEKDGFTPMWLSRRMRDTIPGAEMLVLPAGTHTGLLEHPELVALRTEKFLDERVLPGIAPAGPEKPIRVA